MKILDGTKLARKWEAKLMREKRGQVKDLVGVLVGNDPASVLYLNLKEKMAKRLGIGFRLVKLPATISMKKLEGEIEELNLDPEVGGIIVQLPLPGKLDANQVVNWVAPEKDVDGLSDEVIAKGDVLPATAAGIVEMMREYRIGVEGKRVVLVGFSRLLNVPLSLHLARAGGEVIVLQASTKDYSLLATADVIVTAVGKKNLITKMHLKKGVVVIDAGIVKVGKKVFGDVKFDEAKEIASAITPVPGGVGPMTLVALLANLIKLSKKAVGQ